MSESSPYFVRLSFPAGVTQYQDGEVSRSVYEDLLSLNGRYVEIMTEGMFMFHHSDDCETICGIGGRFWEGIFIPVRKEWLQELTEEEWQQAEALLAKFWEQDDYPD